MGMTLCKTTTDTGLHLVDGTPTTFIPTSTRFLVQNKAFMNSKIRMKAFSWFTLMFFDLPLKPNLMISKIVTTRPTEGVWPRLKWYDISRVDFLYLLLLMFRNIFYNFNAVFFLLVFFCFCLFC